MANKSKTADNNRTADLHGLGQTGLEDPRNCRQIDCRGIRHNAQCLLYRLIKDIYCDLWARAGRGCLQAFPFWNPVYGI